MSSSICGDCKEYEEFVPKLQERADTLETEVRLLKEALNLTQNHDCVLVTSAELSDLRKQRDEMLVELKGIITGIEQGFILFDDSGVRGPAGERECDYHLKNWRDRLNSIIARAEKESA